MRRGGRSTEFVSPIGDFDQHPKMRGLLVVLLVERGLGDAQHQVADGGAIEYGDDVVGLFHGHLRAVAVGHETMHQDAAGVATITSDSEKPTPPAIWCFDVEVVSLAGATYDAGAGVTRACEGADATLPSLVSAEVDGTSLVLTYDEPLDAFSVPAAADFTVTAGTPQPVSTVAVGGSTVTLTLTTPGVANGNTVDVSTATYTNDIGDTELSAVWTDPDFDPTRRAAY